MEGFWQDMLASPCWTKINAFSVAALVLYTLGGLGCLFWAFPSTVYLFTGDPKEVVSIIVFAHGLCVPLAKSGHRLAAASLPA